MSLGVQINAQSFRARHKNCFAQIPLIFVDMAFEKKHNNLKK